MEFSDVIKSRRSIRKFKSNPIPDGYVKELLEAARLAPSGLNLQPWRYVVVKDKSVKADIISTTPSPFASDAAVIILCCSDLTAFDTAAARTYELYEAGALSKATFERYVKGDLVKDEEIDGFVAKANLAFNVAISIEHIILKATDLGLGACWLGVFDQGRIREVVGLDGKYEILSLIAIGYPDQNPFPRPRLPLSEILLKEI